MRQFGDGWSAGRRAWLSRRPPWLRVPLAAIGWILHGVYLVPSLALSFVDYVLVRILAVLAGTTIPWFSLRYAAVFVWLLGGAYIGWKAPPPYGLFGVAAGILAVAAVVRRWSWIERDRESFLAARRSDPRMVRIGFAEDLRDEALTAIVFLFLLIPLGLHQISEGYRAFDLQKLSGEPDILHWIGFFGAELAKAVPFVDWSEVFKVHNGSPIEPKTALGAQVVFALRASLDLLLLAAVLQAWQIAARLRDQYNAFWVARALPILDPFAERGEFRKVALGLSKHPHVKFVEQPPVVEFPHYEKDQLCDIAEGVPPGGRATSTVLTDSVARRGALAVLVRQYPEDKKTVETLRDRIAHEAAPGFAEFRRFALQLASEPAYAAVALQPLLHDKAAPVELRVAAARELGRLRHAQQDTALSLLADDGEALALRAQAGLWLAKLGTGRAVEPLQKLASAFKPDAAGAELIAAMATAYACGLLAKGHFSADEIVKPFAGDVAPHALRAIRSALGELDRMVRIPAGTFMMGSPEDEKERWEAEGPQHTVTIGTDFELGRYAVTFEEYDAFCKATDPDKRPGDRDWGREQRPVINVSWEDANAYCDWLNAFTGERYRLPSEAEWEYACRAGTTTAYSFGDNIDKTQAQFSEGEWGSAKNTVEVGSFPANAFGLHDMHGNVWEWCGDPWHGDYEGAPTDGSVWLQGGEESRRVLRGGSWGNGPQILRSALRIGNYPDFRVNRIGFRLART